MVSTYGNKIYHCPGFLYCNYILIKTSAIKLAREVGCGNTTMYRNLRRWNIKIRTNSEANSGELHQNYGKHLSEETKKRIGLGNKGKKHSEEWIKKLSDSKKKKWKRSW